MSDPNNEKNYTQFTKKVTVGCYIALAVAVLFFSGLLNNVEGFTYIYTVRIDRKEKTWTELDTTVYSAAGVALLSSKDAQKPTKIEDDTMGAEVMQALWGK